MIIRASSDIGAHGQGREESCRSQGNERVTRTTTYQDLGESYCGATLRSYAAISFTNKREKKKVMISD